MRAVSDGSDPHEAISATPVSTRFANQPFDQCVRRRIVRDRLEKLVFEIIAQDTPRGADPL